MAQQTKAPQGQNDSYELKEGQINIFTNQLRDKDSQPDYWGKCVIDGVEKRISLWKNIGKSGNPYLGGQIQDYQPNDGAPQSSAVQTAIADVDSDNGSFM